MRATLALAGITAVTLSCALAAGGQARSLGAALHADAYPRLTGIHVSGTKLVNGDGTTVVLHGIDRSGTEYACIQGWGIFDGPNVLNDDAQVPLMKAWGANEVLIGLNEDCWLGINGVRAAYGGKNYVKAIVHETKTLESYDIYPVISDFWMAPGTIQATDQDPMPDNSHSPAFWRSVANTFKGDPNIIFRLKEEPYPDNNSNSTAAWECWNKGDVQYGPTGSLTPISRVSHCDDGYAAVGMQSLINIIRGTGAKNVIEVPGIQYANTMTDFLSPGIRVHDTLSPPQLVADVDVYPDFNGCGTVSCYNREYAPVIKQMPFVAGETGVGGCTTTGVDTFMSWMNTEHSGYGGWAWDAWGGCGVLIASYNGTPTYPWGIDFKDRLLTLSGHPPPSPPHPTDGITIAQATPASCITTPSEKVQLSGAVPAGDDLVLVVAGQGYTGAASSVTGVNDNVNGAWT
ncbi:MAG TPA: cellulase family glycosylhydrolase, partial [Acidimicrobiales bacterium]|nr:cellulase family glycosylhydrolase [Acidimicrobiales bacterium]